MQAFGKFPGEAGGTDRRGGGPDAAAQAVLQGAVLLAEQQLANRHETLAVDEAGAPALQAAVDAVARSKPAVDDVAAELVSALVAWCSRGDCLTLSTS